MKLEEGEGGRGEGGLLEAVSGGWRRLPLGERRSGFALVGKSLGHGLPMSLSDGQFSCQPWRSLVERTVSRLFEAPGPVVTGGEHDDLMTSLLQGDSSIDYEPFGSSYSQR